MNFLKCKLADLISYPEDPFRRSSTDRVFVSTANLFGITLAALTLGGLAVGGLAVVFPSQDPKA